MVTTQAFAAMRSAQSRQAGVILLVTLIFMTVLALIVLAGMRGGLLQERMASNARNRQVALQAGEAVARDAEVNVVRVATAPFDPFTPTSFVANCANGFCSRPVNGATPRWQTLDWTSTSATRSFLASTSNISTAVVPSQPRYMIELINTPVISPAGGGGICPTVVSRVTSQGVGFDSAEVFVQTMYRTRPQYC